MNNSIAEKKPELIAEWSEKNYPLFPEHIPFGSNKRYWWKGACGHEWEASAKARSAGEGCPVCSNTRIIPGINDLKIQYPKLMEEWSSKNTINPDYIGAGSHKKAIWVGKCGHEWSTEIRYRVNGAGCPYCSHNKVLTGLNDLATLYPEVAKEWSRRNYPLKATGVTAYSNKRVWWKCQKGHEWESRIADRSYGSECPYCRGIKILAGFNDLATMYPQIASEWSEKNGTVAPDTVSVKSTKNVWWRCSTCGHEYRAVVKSRVKGLVCPVCAQHEVMAGYNDLATTDPDLLEEWDYQKNTGILPTIVSRYSAKEVWWKGACGHIWKDKVSGRVVEGKKCPVCEKEFNRFFHQMLIGIYAKRKGLYIEVQYEKLLGIPLDAYIPELELAFIFPRKRTEHDRIVRKITKDLCSKKRIQCIEITKSDLEEICIEVKKGFAQTHTYIGSDIKQDIKMLREQFEMRRV